MAKVHILDRTGQQTFRVVLHIAVPNTTNGAGVNWRTALINSGLGGKTVLPDGDGTAGTIGAAEKASLVSGAVYELVEEWELLTGGASGANVQSFIDARYTAAETAALAALQKRLAQYGRTRDVP